MIMMGITMSSRSLFLSLIVILYSAIPPKALAVESKPLAASQEIQRVWGKQSNGFSVSLTLDKEHYSVGEIIPLHLACTRFNEDWEVFDDNKLCEPYIEIRDNAGKPVALEHTNRKFSHGIPCGISIGHGARFIKHIEEGVIIPYEMVLDDNTCLNDGFDDTGVFISRAGTYSIVAKWNPAYGSKDEASSVPITFTIGRQ